MPSGFYTANELNPSLRLSRLFAFYSKDDKRESGTLISEKNISEKCEKVSKMAEKDLSDDEEYPPYNFSWLVEKRIAGMGWPQKVSNLNYIANRSINHLVTLSPERVPPILECRKKLKWTEIPVKEFQAPTLHQILKFIDICERAELRGEVIGVHCRQGRGRTGVMLACYFIKFKDMAPERAVMTVRVLRPGSCETYEQEKAVCYYHDCLRGTIEKPDWRLVDDKRYFDASFTEDEPAAEEAAQEKEEAPPEIPKKKKSKAMVINHKIYF